MSNSMFCLLVKHLQTLYDVTTRGFQCFVLNAFVCTEKFVKEITTNTAQIFVTTGFRVSVSNS